MPLIVVKHTLEQQTLIPTYQVYNYVIHQMVGSYKQIYHANNFDHRWGNHAYKQISAAIATELVGQKRNTLYIYKFDIKV